MPGWSTPFGSLWDHGIRSNSQAEPEGETHGHEVTVPVTANREGFGLLYMPGGWTTANNQSAVPTGQESGSSDSNGMAVALSRHQREIVPSQEQPMPLTQVAPGDVQTSVTRPPVGVMPRSEPQEPQTVPTRPGPSPLNASLQVKNDGNTFYISEHATVNFDYGSKFDQRREYHGSNSERGMATQASGSSGSQGPNSVTDGQAPARSLSSNSMRTRALLKPHHPDASPLWSKYMIQAKYQLHAGGPPITIALTVNTDVVVPKFWSRGAMNDPRTPELSLEVKFQKIEHLTGFAQFEGYIGDGQIHLTTNKGVVISGPIEQGPEGVQSFTGMGTWLMS